MQQQHATLNAVDYNARFVKKITHLGNLRASKWINFRLFNGLLLKPVARHISSTLSTHFKKHRPCTFAAKGSLRHTCQSLQSNETPVQVRTATVGLPRKRMPWSPPSTTKSVVFPDVCFSYCIWINIKRVTQKWQYAASTLNMIQWKSNSNSKELNKQTTKQACSFHRTTQQKKTCNNKRSTRIMGICDGS